MLVFNKNRILSFKGESCFLYILHIKRKKNRGKFDHLVILTKNEGMNIIMIKE